MSSPVEQIKQRLNIVDVVGSYIKLQKAGANFKAACPFHSEKAPSFYVSPPREIWHCFGCNRGGDMFEFVKQIEGIEFPEALRILADRAGVTITRQDPRIRSEKTRLLDLLKDAAAFYQRQLTENKDALNYLWKRGLKNKTLENFNIGFAQNEAKGWRNLFDYLKSKGYSADEVEKAGMAVKNIPNYYDRFRSRIMFPLKDTSGRIVGFSARIFGEEKEGTGKYINTPQTILYDKSRILYGFDRAKTEIRKQDSCVLVEGQMDVLMSHQAGAENTVAVSGTALTNGHLEIIKRLTNNLIMAFDSDEAGLQAAKRSIDLGLKEGLEVRAISLPKGKDPADIIQKNLNLWRDKIKKAEHIIGFYLNVLEEKYKKDDRRFKLEVGKNILQYVLLIQNSIDRSHWISEIARAINVKEEIILEEMKKIRMNEKPQKQELSTSPVKSRQTLIREKLAGIALWKRDKKTIPSFVKNLKKNEKEKLAFEAELYYSGSENLDEELKNLNEELRKEIIKEQLENLANEVRKMEEQGKTEDLEKKLSEFQKLSKKLCG